MCFLITEASGGVRVLSLAVVTQAKTDATGPWWLFCKVALLGGAYSEKRLEFTLARFKTAEGSVQHSLALKGQAESKLQRRALPHGKGASRTNSPCRIGVANQATPGSGNAERQ